jgi:hypothetical protein
MHVSGEGLPNAQDLTGLGGFSPSGHSIGLRLANVTLAQSFAQIRLGDKPASVTAHPVSPYPKPVSRVSNDGPLPGAPLTLSLSSTVLLSCRAHSLLPSHR